MAQPPIKKRTFSTSKAYAAMNAPELFIDRVPMKGVPAKATQTSTLPLTSSSTEGLNLDQIAGDLIPYASNIINSFRRPPMPKQRASVPISISPRIRLDARRAKVADEVRTMNVAADRGLDENTAAAVKRSSMAGQLRELSNISEVEANANAQITAGDNQLNSRINMYNASKTDEFSDMLTERSLAQQRFSQQNIADISDKYMRQTEERDKAQLDRDKYTVLKTLWEKSGVNDRVEESVRKKMESMGYRANGGRLKMYAGGGPMTGGEDDIEVIITDADRQLAAKDSYSRGLFGKNTEALYASGFRPRNYGKDLIYTDNSNLFQTQGDNRQIGYLPGASGMRRVFINKDNSYDFSDDVNMDSNMVMDEIKRIHKGRSNQLIAKNKYGGSLTRKRMY